MHTHDRRAGLFGRLGGRLRGARVRSTRCTGMPEEIAARIGRAGRARPAGRLARRGSPGSSTATCRSRPALTRLGHVVAPVAGDGRLPARARLPAAAAARDPARRRAGAVASGRPTARRARRRRRGEPRVLEGDRRPARSGCAWSSAPVRLEIYGDGSLRERARAAGARARASTRASTASSPISASGSAELDVLVLPSRARQPAASRSSRRWPRGLPVVGTRVGGIPELVVDGETGFVVEPDDAARARRRARAACARARSGASSSASNGRRAGGRAASRRRRSRGGWSRSTRSCADPPRDPGARHRRRRAGRSSPPTAARARRRPRGRSSRPRPGRSPRELDARAVPAPARPAHGRGGCPRAARARAPGGPRLAARRRARAQPGAWASRPGSPRAAAAGRRALVSVHGVPEDDWPATVRAPARRRACRPSRAAPASPRRSRSTGCRRLTTIAERRRARPAARRPRGARARVGDPAGNRSCSRSGGSCEQKNHALAIRGARRGARARRSRSSATGRFAPTLERAGRGERRRRPRRLRRVRVRTRAR